MQPDVRQRYLEQPVEHIDITRFDAVLLVEAIHVLFDKREGAPNRNAPPPTLAIR